MFGYAKKLHTNEVNRLLYVQENFLLPPDYALYNLSHYRAKTGSLASKHIGDLPRLVLNEKKLSPADFNSYVWLVGGCKILQNMLVKPIF